jgi:hypothetical protein
MHRRTEMRTTLELPEALIEEAMALTHITTKTDLIKTALQNLIQKEKIRGIKEYFGKVDLGIDLDVMRKR